MVKKRLVISLPIYFSYNLTNNCVLCFELKYIKLGLCSLSIWALQLETTADRIKAVDQAAAMVDEMLKQGSMNSGTKVVSISAKILKFMTLDLYTTVGYFFYFSLGNSAIERMCVPGFWTRPIIKYRGSNTWTKCKLLSSTFSSYIFISCLIFKLMFWKRCIVSLCFSGVWRSEGGKHIPY